MKYWMGPNDGGIKRGDGAETGDDQAQPTAGTGRGGSGVRGGDKGEGGAPTAVPSSLSESTGSVPGEATEDLDGFEILDADDPTLGMTDVPEKGDR